MEKNNKNGVSFYLLCIIATFFGGYFFYYFYSKRMNKLASTDTTNTDVQNLNQDWRMVFTDLSNAYNKLIN